MSIMELIGQGEGTILYGDRSTELASGGGSKVFRAPFCGYVKGLLVKLDDERDALPRLTVKINGVEVTDFGPGAVFEIGDVIEVVGAPMPGSSGDRIGLEVGTFPVSEPLP
jgi:hypothetical protein